jgi:hypothetical protein
MPDDKPLNGNFFIATGENGLRAFSPDGIAWSHQQTDREGMLLSQVTFAGGRCVAGGRYGGEVTAFATADGVDWQRVRLDDRPYTTRLDMLFTEQNHFVAVLNEDGASPGTRSSDDGQTWSSCEAMLEDWKVMRHDAHLRRIAQGNGRLVAVGDYGARLARKPGVTKWEATADAKARDTLIDIAFGNGAFVGGGLHGLRMRSEDGLTWTDRVVGEEGEHVNAMIFDGQQFVGIGQGATYTSPDGIAWQRTPNENAPTAASFGAGIYIGVLWPGRLLRSTDAIRWDQVHEFPHHVLGLAFGRMGGNAAGGAR